MLDQTSPLNADVAAAARTAGLPVFVEARAVSLPLPSSLVDEHAELFALRRQRSSDSPIDPRHQRPLAGTALAKLALPEALALVLERAQESGRAAAATGVAGLLLHDIGSVAPGTAHKLIVALQHAAPELRLLVKTHDLATFSTMAGAEAIAVDLPESLAAAEFSRRLVEAVLSGQNLIVPSALLDQERAQQQIEQAMRLSVALEPFAGERRPLSDPDAPVRIVARADHPDMRQSTAVLLACFNAGAAPVALPDLASLAPFLGADFEAFEPAEQQPSGSDQLQPGQVRLFRARRAKPIVAPPRLAIEQSVGADRLVLQNLRPSVDGGDFAVKRVVGETVTVEATLFGDGHEQLAAELSWRTADHSDWHSVRMEQLPNDEWRAAFTLPRLGRHEFRVEGWLDRFGGFRRDFAKKLDAGVAQPVDHAEGRALVETALSRASGDLAASLGALLKQAQAASIEQSATLLLSPELASLMDAADDRPHRIRSRVQLIDAERTAARFSSWYELFPRSQTDDPARHGTFADVIERLPAIRDMGFDTLYFPPIHPIGQTNRKGRNNTLTPAPEDPGSPYAIGAPEGGHDALHPELGTFEDFRRLIEAAQAHGLEIALDFAVQCSPDHPWLKQHPGWFAWRPDGSMKYAENPPKKYQDIVNVDFYGPDAVPDLWLALRDVVLLWVEHGVKTFRVDNPHTKPLPFWEWMIGDLRARHPELIFLAEAFTRPAMMYQLAKIGFSQSYTYFTWRDRKQELIDYIVELTTTAPKEFYRPHLFVNTPDINPPFLQTSGRPGFRIRAALAATLSGLFGVYSGFELCEAAPVPGKEEYLDSEKYEIKPRDWQAPGNIIADITLLNRLRRTYPALQTHLNTQFYVAHNENIVWYGKPAPDGSHKIMVMVSLDPHHAQEADFEVPLWEFGLPDNGSVAVTDLASEHRFRWQGKMQHIRLDPQEPYRIWRIAPGDGA